MGVQHTHPTHIYEAEVAGIASGRSVSSSSKLTGEITLIFLCAMAGFSVIASITVIYLRKRIKIAPTELRCLIHSLSLVAPWEGRAEKEEGGREYG